MLTSYNPKLMFAYCHHLKKHEKLLSDLLYELLCKVKEELAFWEIGKLNYSISILTRVGKAHFDGEVLTTIDFPVSQADDFALLEKLVLVKSDQYILSHPLTFLDTMEI